MLAGIHQAPSWWSPLADVLIDETGPGLGAPAYAGSHLFARFPGCQLVVTTCSGNEFEVLRRTGQSERVALGDHQPHAAIVCALAGGYVHLSPHRPPGALAAIAQHALVRWRS